MNDCESRPGDEDEAPGSPTRDKRQFAGHAGERDFLWEEIDRYRNRLMDYLRWEMMLPEGARAELNKVRKADRAVDQD